MIIALDASDILSTENVDVQLSSSVEDALGVLAETDISFAVLDVNLGAQTSLPVAEKLQELQIPFVLATGYGDVETILSEYPPAPIVRKPFTSESLLREVHRAVNPED